jgi:hypothetical protein
VEVLFSLVLVIVSHTRPAAAHTPTGVRRCRTKVL